MLRSMMTFSVLVLMAAPALAFENEFKKAEWKFIMETMAEMQRLSFEKNREYCGYFGYVNGEFGASRIARGRKSSCRAYIPAEDFEAVASFHTHGRYNPRFYSEVPSTDDVRTDNEEGINGFMATPGGRFWFIDGYKMTAELICDLECLPQDHRFEPDPDLDLQTFYYFKDLVALEGY